MNASKPRSAYIHVPFCRHRCGYCNFTLVAGRDDLIDAYIDAVEREMSWLVEPQEVDTLFLGGGTPTHLSPAQLHRLLTAVHHWFPVSSNYEFSVEANPVDIDQVKVGIFTEFGVTRVSLGVQSFHDDKLILLERDHRRAEIEQAIQHLRNRVKSVSLDLIFGVPGESLQTWQADLRAAISLNPDHVSTYGLTFERGTSYWSRKLKSELESVDEEVERQMYETSIDMLSAAGFEHYEVSNFARVNHRCRHNEVYWTGRGYFAVGPGAARFVNGRREMNHRSTTTYIQRVLAGQTPTTECEELPPADAARERLVFGLRRLDGIDRDEFARQTGFDVQELVGNSLQTTLDAGLLIWKGTRLQLTRAGLMISDAIWTKFLRE